MEFLRMLSAAFAGTAVMTVFSYIVAEIMNTQFREPQLLNRLLSSSKMIKGKFRKSSLAGWLIHYSIGTMFVLCFAILWDYTQIGIGWTSATIFGFCAGIVGILGWKTMFTLNSDPPEILLKDFSVQLIIAHIIFALGAFVFYRSLQ